MIIAYFFHSVVWSIGAVLMHSSRLKFSAFFVDLIDGLLAKHPR